ncbi:MAG: serine hydrolase domain-containing protein [Chloroflexota bacterium]
MFDLVPPHLNKYVDEGKLPGYLLLVARQGQPAFVHRYGMRDVDAGLPVEEDTIFRFYSMTKPITSVALLSLYEQGLFQLNDPVSRFIPTFKALQVYEFGEGNAISTKPADREMTIRDLFTHTAGFTYGFLGGHPVADLYSQRDIRSGTAQEMVTHLADLPLLFSPGTRWNYSVATDVLGYLIEVISGLPLDRFFAETIFQPLGMKDTGFYVPEEKVSRFACCYDYAQDETSRDTFVPSNHPTIGRYLSRPTFLSGGGGLVSTMADYFRFTQMMLNKGVLGGERILGRKTVELMTSNHLPNNRDLAGMGMPVFSETPYDGIGFGLGVSVVLNPAAAQILGSPGEYAWGGLASTAFWIDPAEEMIVIFLTQLIPSSSYPIRQELRVMTYQSIEN